MLASNLSSLAAVSDFPISQGRIYIWGHTCYCVRNDQEQHTCVMYTCIQIEKTSTVKPHTSTHLSPKRIILGRCIKYTSIHIPLLSAVKKWCNNGKYKGRRHSASRITAIGSMTDLSHAVLLCLASSQNKSLQMFEWKVNSIKTLYTFSRLLLIKLWFSVQCGFTDSEQRFLDRVFWF